MRTCITFMRHKGMKNVILHSSLSPKERYYYDYIYDVPLSWIILCNEKWKIKILYSSNRIQISSTIFIHISKTLNRAWIYTYIHGDDTLFFFLFLQNNDPLFKAAGRFFLERVFQPLSPVPRGRREKAWYGCRVKFNYKGVNFTGTPCGRQ